MTLAQELMGCVLPIRHIGRRVELEDPPFRLPFDGTLSQAELRLLEQGVFDGPFSFEGAP
jgi:hypothetical protein